MLMLRFTMMRRTYPSGSPWFSTRAHASIVRSSASWTRSAAACGLPVRAWPKRRSSGMRARANSSKAFRRSSSTFTPGIVYAMTTPDAARGLHYCVGKPLTLANPSRRQTLSEPQQVGRVGRRLDRDESRQVGTVVGVLPVRQLGVDVVQVGESAHIGPHHRVDAVEPGLVGRDGPGRGADAPRRDVLKAGELVAVHEGGVARCDRVDGTAVRVEEHAAAWESEPAPAGDAIEEHV